MSHWLIKLYVGPVAVRYSADQLRAAGFDVHTEGTAHVYFVAPDLADGWGAIGAMENVREKSGLRFGATDWQPYGPRPVVTLNRYA